MSNTRKMRRNKQVQQQRQMSALVGKLIQPPPSDGSWQYWWDSAEKCWMRHDPRVIAFISALVNTDGVSEASADGVGDDTTDGTETLTSDSGPLLAPSDKSVSIT